MKEEIKPVLINLADYEEVGEGANGISLNHKTDPTVLLKLYTRGSIQQPLDEWLLSKQVYEAGIPTPEPGEFVTDGTCRKVSAHRYDTWGLNIRLASP